MPLQVTRCDDASPFGVPVAEAVRRAIEGRGCATLLVPTFAQALDAQRSLAERGLSLGVTVATPLAWATERWELWGTGERVATADAATLVMHMSMEAAAHDASDGIAANAGTVRLLCDLARRALPWLPLDAEGSVDDAAALSCGLSPAESRVVSLVGAYGRALCAHGLVEASEALAHLPKALVDAGVAVAPTILAGFVEMDRMTRELAVSLAAVADVTVVVSSGTSLAVASSRMLVRMARARGVDVVERARATDGAEGSVRAPELDDLARMLYATDDAGRDVVTATGAVRVLEPAGPLAEAELVARTLTSAAKEGVRTAVVVAPDARRAWRELAPKLLARGLSARAQLVVPFSKTEAGRAFAEFARSVADLAIRADAWPVDEDGLRRLGDMGWWPPRALSDFLLCDIARTDRRRAGRVDAAWRSERLLAPADVLDGLLSAKTTSTVVERATRELLRGRIGSAAARLLAPFAAESTTSETNVASGSDGPVAAYAALEATAALEAVIDVAGTLRDLGLSADPKEDGALALVDLVDRALLALEATSVTIRPALGVPGSSCEVRVLAPAQAALVVPSSVDAVVACGLTSDEWPVAARESLLDELLVALGVEEGPDQVGRARARFEAIVSAPRRLLVLERSLRSDESRPRWPSPLLQDVLACYADGALVPEGLGEDAAAANASASGVAPVPVAQEALAPAGLIDAALRDIVVVPPDGLPSLPGGLPLLSASQIESYLECPYKWFSLRRLGLRDADAGCGALEMGSFAHRVLELARRGLLGEALASCRVSSPRQAEVLAILSGLATDGRGRPVMPTDVTTEEALAALAMRVPGSRPSIDDPASLDRTRHLVRSAFDEHLAHQRLRAPRRDRQQALVAHTALERGLVDGLRRDLASVVDYEAERLVGFEPRLFEWSFGGKATPVSYAGAQIVGTVDRLDVDAHGQAVVVDYKHKGPAGFVAEYGAFGAGGHDPLAPPALPRRVQALVYGQVVRRAFPGVKVVGAVYLGTRGDHALAGAVSADQVDRVLGPSATAATVARTAVVGDPSCHASGSTDMEALLDAVEQGIALRIDELRAGNVEARPIDAASCRFCPVMRCERRLGR